jgi:hypothetical protein
VPYAQRLFVGVEAVAIPLADPQDPLTGVFGFEAEQLTGEPPLEPAHDQVHGPVPEIEDAVPVKQRSLKGGAITVVPFAEPQTPLTAANAQACVEAGWSVVIPQPFESVTVLVCWPFAQVLQDPVCQTGVQETLQDCN